MRGLRRPVWTRPASQRARVEQSTRWAIYSFPLIEAGLLATVLVRIAAVGAGWATAAVSVVSALHVATNLELTRVGLRHYLASGPGGEDAFPDPDGADGADGADGPAGVARPDRPDRLVAALTATNVLGVALVCALTGTGRLPDEAMVVTCYLVVYSAGSLPLVATVRRAFWLGLPPIAVGLVGGVLAGRGGWTLLVVLAVTLGASLLVGGASRMSAWTLRVIAKLDAARETEARLAVAEERLRFGRDLHDVLGRNLSVIALKSELAGQLAQRGSPAAVDQMVEVQRIARESQREMREVVRGYRRAQLQGELAGARGVLEAAGIRCRIEGGDSATLPEEVQSTLGWVVREGTTNVLRHARADRCTVRLRRTAGGRVVLDMENDGAAPPAGRGGLAGPGGGSGLAGLRERVAALGGSLSADRGEGDTFRLRAEVPSAVPAAGGRPAAPAGTATTAETAGTATTAETAETATTAETAGTAGAAGESGSGRPDPAGGPAAWVGGTGRAEEEA